MQKSTRAQSIPLSIKHAAAVVSTVFLLSALLVVKASHADTTTAKPNADLSPQQVINIVVESLQNNASDDAGIATVFRFASPGNKASTGPLAKFTRMIKRGFPDMLNHIGARYDSMELEGDTAVQAVWLQTVSGSEFGYAFQLRKQQAGQTEGMWMTEAVVPLGKGQQSGIGI